MLINLVKISANLIKKRMTRERFSVQEKDIHRMTLDIERANVDRYHLKRDLKVMAEGIASTNVLRWGTYTTH